MTLPEELAEEVREAVGPGLFSQYVTQAIERQRERDRLHEWVEWWEQEYGRITEDELAKAQARRREIERMHVERKARLAEDGDSAPDRKAS